METIGLISNNLFIDNDESISIYLNHSLNNGYDLNQLFIDSEIEESEIIKKGNFNTLVNDFSFRNKRLLIFNSRDIAENLPILIENYIKLYDRRIQIELINSETKDLLSDGLLRLGYLKPKTEKEIKIAETIKSKSIKGSFLGRAPFGYFKSHSGGFVTDPDKAELINVIFNLYSGNYGESSRIGLRKISKLVRDNYLFRDLKWTPQTIKKILTNRFYTGVYKRDLVIISNNHDSFITNEKFDFVQNLFINSKVNFSKIKQGKNNRDRILFKCGYCNNKLNKSIHHRKWKNVNGEEFNKIYTYLNCNNTQCRKVINMRLEVDKSYIDSQKKNNENNSEFANYNTLVNAFRNNIKLVIRGKLKVSNLKYDIDRLREYEKHFKISNPKDEYNKVVKVKNNFNKILTTV